MGELYVLQKNMKLQPYLLLASLVFFSCNEPDEAPERKVESSHEVESATTEITASEDDKPIIVTYPVPIDRKDDGKVKSKNPPLNDVISTTNGQGPILVPIPVKK